MKKITLSAVALGLIVSANAAEDLSSMISEGKVSGQVRMFYVDRQYEGGNTTHRNATALGGNLKFETGDYKGLSLASAFYTTNDIGGLWAYGPGAKTDPSLVGTGYENYSIIGEAYVNYDMSSLGTKTVAKLGYQRYDTPMMGSDDARMLPNTFEAYKLENKDFSDVTIQFAHVKSIAYGSFNNIYSGGIFGATSGYAMNGNPGTGKYLNLGNATTGKNTAGVTNFLVSYKDKNFNVKISDDYAWDMYNTLYAEAGATWNCLLNENIHPFIAVQAVKQNSVGGEFLKNVALDNGTGVKVNGNGEVDSFYWAAKVGAKYSGFTTYLAYSQVGENTDAELASGNAYANAIISQFGGMPAFTQGMVTRHEFLAGTEATKVVVAYDFNTIGTNVTASAFYTSFDIDKNSGYGGQRTTTEPGFDVQYYPEAVKGLQLRFRGDFPRGFAGTDANPTGWDEYRLIANYNF